MATGRTRKDGKKIKQESKSEFGDYLKGVTPVEKHKSMADLAYNRLKKAIVNGDLKPGQRLVEQKLSEKMKTSRVPVREAIKRLEQYGLVQKLPVRGFIVKKVSEDEVREAFGIRSALESHAAAMATEHLDDKMLAALEAGVEAFRQALEDGDMEKVVELNARFHETIYEAAKSPMLYKLINTFMDYIARYSKPLLSSKTNAAASLEGHRAMVEAMRKGDIEGVERLVKAHILQGRDYILTAMRSGEFE